MSKMNWAELNAQKEAAWAERNLVEATYYQNELILRALDSIAYVLKNGNGNV